MLICNFPLKIDPIGPDVPNNKMFYGDFFIRYEHKLLRNIYIYIYTKEQLASAPCKNIPKHCKNTTKHSKILLTFV